MELTTNCKIRNVLSSAYQITRFYDQSKAVSTFELKSFVHAIELMSASDAGANKHFVVIAAAALEVVKQGIHGHGNGSGKVAFFSALCFYVACIVRYISFLINKT